MEGLSINLAGESFKGIEPGVLGSLPFESQKELENVEKLKLGEKENSCFVLPKPIEATYHNKYDEIGIIDIPEHTVKYLLITPESQKFKTLTFTLQILTEGVTLNNPEPLYDFQRLLESGDEKEMQRCRFQTYEGYSIFAFGKWTVSTEIKRNLAENGMLKIVDHKDYRLESPTKEELEKFMQINRRQQTIQDFPAAA